MSTILLSFECDWFSLLESGEKKFEYRKHFPKGKTTVYFYVSKPVMAITGIAEFAEREELSDWLKKYEDRPSEVKERIADMMSDCKYAIPCVRFQKTNKIPLLKLRTDIDNFIVPRMYYYLDDLPMLKYLENTLKPIGNAIYHQFDVIADDDIC